MTTINNSERQKQDLGSHSEVWWRQLLFLGIIGLGLFLLVAPNAWRRSSAGKPEPSAPRRVPESVQPSNGTQRTGLLGPSDSWLTRGQDQRESELREGWTTGRETAASVQPLEPVQHSQPLDALLMQLKSTSVITGEGAKEIRRLLRDLRKQGVAAVPAIREFLLQQSDVNFAKMKGGELLDHGTLRQELIHTLG